MEEPEKGFFAVKDIVCNAGMHIIKLWRARISDALKEAEKTFVFAEKAANLTLSALRFHYSPPSKDLSRVAIAPNPQTNIYACWEFNYSTRYIFACSKVDLFPSFRNYLHPGMYGFRKLARNCIVNN